ncbi:MAG: lipoate--protein ligase family protein [Acidithiobacillus sp.]
MEGRRLDLGLLDPLSLHAGYAGMAEAQPAGALPMVLLARSSGHLSLGAAQGAAAELDPAACRRHGVPVVRRPLGGGTVWVDAQQLNYFFLFPAGSGPARPAAAFSLVAPVVEAVHRAFGLPVTGAGGQDFWCRGRKIGGTGAATLGHTLILGGSFILDFHRPAFTRCVALPSPGFREWLGEALAGSLTSWTGEGVGGVAASAVAESFWAALAAQGWRLQPSVPTAAEGAAVAEAREDLDDLDWEEGARRRVPHGIKLKSGAFLTERHWDGGQWLRVWTDVGQFRRVAASVFPAGLGELLSGLGPADGRFAHLLDQALGAAAPLWRERLLATAVWSD